MTDRATNDHLTLPVPNSLRIDDADIYLIGFGLRIPNDLTLEAIAALNRCQRVFGVPPIDLTSIGLPRVEDLTLWRRQEAGRDLRGNHVVRNPGGKGITARRSRDLWERNGWCLPVPSAA